MRYEVRLTRTVADTLKTYVHVEADTPEQAEQIALAMIGDEKIDDYYWVFDSCGDSVGDPVAEVLL